MSQWSVSDPLSSKSGPFSSCGRARQPRPHGSWEMMEGPALNRGDCPGARARLPLAVVR